MDKHICELFSKTTTTTNNRRLFQACPILLCLHLVGTRAAVDRCGPGRCTTPPFGDRRRPGPGSGGSEQNCTATIRRTPTPKPELFDLSDEGPGGVRPLTLAELRPQERVLRHIAEQIGDVAPVVPALGVPVPLIQLVAVLKPVDSTVPEQIFAVPKISLPSRPLRAVRVSTQMVEQLEEVPAYVAAVVGRAMVGSTVDTYSASARGWLYGRTSHNFHVFG